MSYEHKASVIVEHLSHRHLSKAERDRIEEILDENELRGSSIPQRILAITYEQKDLVDIIAEMLGVDFKAYLRERQPYLTSEQINGLISQGYSIGGHSIDHPLYEKLPLEMQISQTLESVSFVRNKFGLNYGAFAFPHTDRGVSAQYFKEIEKGGLVDVSFGTSGMIQEPVLYHFQRFSLENPPLPARKIFAYQYAKRIWRTIMMRNKVVR